MERQSIGDVWVDTYIATGWAKSRVPRGVPVVRVGVNGPPDVRMLFTQQELEQTIPVLQRALDDLKRGTPVKRGLQPTYPRRGADVSDEQRKGSSKP